LAHASAVRLAADQGRGASFRLDAAPFAPFRNRYLDGSANVVPTPDCFTTMRLSRRDVLENDGLSGAAISPLNIAAIEPLAPASGK